MCLPTSTSLSSLFGSLFQNSILLLPRRALGWLCPRSGQGGWRSWSHAKSPGSFLCLCCSKAILNLHGMSLKPVARISPGLFHSSGSGLGASATFPWWITLMATQATLDSSLAFNPGPLPGRLISLHPQSSSSSFHKSGEIFWVSSSPHPKSLRRYWGAKFHPPSSAALLYLDAADPVWSRDRLERQSPCELPSR